MTKAVFARICSGWLITMLAACSMSDAPETAESGQPEPTLAVLPDGAKADNIIVDKSDRTLIVYQGGKELIRYNNIRLGDVPQGHKQFEGDERTPEGNYEINDRNPGSSYHLSLRISYPNATDISYAEGLGRSPGGDIFIHGQPNGYTGPAISRDWTDGCIAISNAEIEQLWNLVDDGTTIKIQP